VNVLGAGFDAPRGEGVGRESGFEPVGEGLRGGEATVRVRVCEGHGGEFEEATGLVVREREGFGGGGD